MGMYQGDISFPSDLPPGPIVVPKLVIAWWLLCDINDRPKRITVHIYGPPGRTPMGKFDFPVDPVGDPQPLFDDASRMILASPLAMLNLTLPCEGILEVTIETERETLRAGRVLVRIPDHPDQSLAGADASTVRSPTALQRPSEPSAVTAPASEQRPAVARLRRQRSARTPAPE